MAAAYEALATEEEGVSPFDEPACNGHDELQEEIHSDSFSTQTLSQEEDHAAVQLDEDGDDDGAPQQIPQFELLDDHTDGAVLATPGYISMLLLVKIVNNRKICIFILLIDNIDMYIVAFILRSHDALTWRVPVQESEGGRCCECCTAAPFCRRGAIACGDSR